MGHRGSPTDRAESTRGAARAVATDPSASRPVDGALITFTTMYGIVDPDTIPKVLFTVAFSGITTCAFCYLLSEFALRPIAARALESGAPPQGCRSRTDRPDNPRLAARKRSPPSPA